MKICKFILNKKLKNKDKIEPFSAFYFEIKQ